MIVERLTRWNGKKYVLPQGAGVWREIAERLAAYEDAEERGTLLQLPCRVGDMVFACIGDMPKKWSWLDLSECTISEISICESYTEPLFTAICREKAEYSTFWLCEFGKEIFTPGQYYSLYKESVKEGEKENAVRTEIL